MTLIALLLFACDAPPDRSSTPVPAPAPSAPQTDTTGPMVTLSAALSTRIDKLASTQGAPALCAALPEVEAVRTEISRELNAAYAQIPDTPEAGRAFAGAIDALALPDHGFRARRRVEGVQVDIDYPGLGRAAGVDTGVLVAAQPYLEHGFPPHMMQETDVSGCVAPLAAKKELLALSRAWSDAEPCLKGLLREQLIQRISTMGTMSCYCHDEAQTLEDIRAMKPVLVQLTDLQGPATWAGLDAKSRSDEARFGGGCSG